MHVDAINHLQLFYCGNHFSIRNKGDNCLQNEWGEREMTNRLRAIVLLTLVEDCRNSMSKVNPDK